MVYYSSENLLKLKDLDGNVPSIYMVTSNRSAGKTWHYICKAFEHYKETGRKTAFIYRHQYELVSALDILKPVLLEYPQYGKELSSITHARGLFYEIMLDNQSFAFAVSLTNMDSLKKFSSLFFEVDFCIMDEFQLESGDYLKDEIKKLQSLLITIARGGGTQSRHISCFLLGNNVSFLNPYFIFFDINRRYKVGTKFIRGHGWIAEFNYNESASNSIKQNALFRAFDTDYMKYSADNTKLFHEDEFIERPSGNTKYLFTIKHDGNYWGVRECLNTGKTYISEQYDKTNKNIIVFTSGEHSTNTIMLNKHSFVAKKLKESYELGLLRFSNLNSKNVIYDILALDFSK